MTKSEQLSDRRQAALRGRLAPLGPIQLEIADDSHRHRNHPGAADGRGHFRVRIVSAEFDGLTRLQRHQLVFSMVGDLMKSDIHALQVIALAPGEASGA
jgi:BolA protein